MQEVTQGTLVSIAEIGNVQRMTLENASGMRRNFWIGGPPPDWYVPEPEDGPMDGWDDPAT